MADLPSWDDLPDQAPSSGGDLPAWDDLPSSSPDDSSAGGAFLRGAAHGAIPAAGGVLAGIGTGAALGTLGAGPVGTVVGGIAGGIAGGAALEKGEDWLLDKMGWTDKAQDQADQEQHPTARMLGEMAPAALSLKPTGSMMRRAVGGAIGGVAGGAQDLIENGSIDPKNVAAGAAMGAAFPSVNRLGAAAERAGARVGAAVGGKVAAPAAVDPSAPAEAPSRDLKLVPDEVTDEAPVGSADNPEVTAAQAILGKLDPRDPMRAHIEGYIDDLSKAPKQADGQATPSVSPRVSLGVSETAAQPSQDPTISGNETGAPMQKRVRARPSDPTRDYRKNQPGPGTQTQDSVPMSTDAMHPDVAAALSPDEAQTSFRQKTTNPGPEAPVETGLPQHIASSPMPTPEQAPPEVHAQKPGLDQLSTADLQKWIANPNLSPALRDRYTKLLAARQPAEPAAPVETGLPQAQAPAPEPAAPVETGITAAVTPPRKLPTSPPGRNDPVAAVRSKLEGVGFKKALDAFNAMSPEVQAEEAPKFLALTENTRKARVAETGVQYRDKADQARKEGSTKAVQQAVEEATRAGSNRPQLTLERTPENKAAIREHAEDLYERAKELYDGRDPVKYVKGDAKSGYVPTNPSPEHNLVIRARKVATNAKATWATLEDYVHAVNLKGETGKNVDADIAMKHRPSVEDAQGGTVQDASREAFEPVPDVPQGKDNSYVEAQNRARDYVNDLSPNDYSKLAKEYDLHNELDEPADPDDLLSQFKQTLADTGKRPGKIELVPAEDVKGGKKTKITDAAGLDRFAPTEEGGKANEGIKSLKEADPAKFAELAAKYGNMKAPDRTGRLEAEQTATTAPEKPIKGTWDAVTEMANKFLGDEGGGGPPMFGRPKVPEFVKNFFTRDPYDPSSQHRSEQVTSMLDQYPKWFKAHSNQRAIDKGQIAGNGIKAMALDLSKNDWATINQAYETKGEKALPGKLRDAAKEVVDPLLTKGNALYKELYDMDQSQGLGLNLPEPHDGLDNRYMPRLRLDEDTADPTDQNVVTGNSFSSWAPSLQAREYMGLRDNATGNRLVLHVGDDGKFSIAQNGNFRPLTKLPTGFAGKVGESLPLYSGGKKATFTVDHAAIDEIEAATKGGKGEVTYQKNPIVTLSNWVNQLQAAKANIETMAKIKNDPDWLNNTTTDKDVAKKRGYDLIPTKLKQLGEKNGADVYMPSNVRWLLDDAFKAGFGGDDSKFLRSTASGLARIFMTFGSPIHVTNVATNAIIGRGFDNITPQGIRALGVTGVRAFKAVNDAANSKDYGDFLKAGGRPQFLSTITNDLIPNITRRLGADIASNTSKWDPIAKMWGISSPDMARAVENFSTKEMWRLSDMMAVQRFLENRDFKGMSPEDAAADVHKFIPAYDLPPTVGGQGDVGRFLSQLLADPRTSLFGRYHMDLLRSFGHVTRSVLGPSSTPTERAKGVGQMLAAAALGYVAYPALDKLAQKVSGNEGAETGRRGMLAITDALQKMVEGKSDYTKLATQLFTPSVPLSIGTKAIANTTWNRKEIVQQMPLNSGRNVAKAAGQAADWTAQNIVPPYGNIAGDLTKGVSPAGAAAKFGAGMVGVRLPSDAARAYEAKQDQINNRAMKTRDKHPAGPLEWLASTFGR